MILMERTSFEINSALDKFKGYTILGELVDSDGIKTLFQNTLKKKKQLRLSQLMIISFPKMVR